MVMRILKGSDGTTTIIVHGPSLINEAYNTINGYADRVFVNDGEIGVRVRKSKGKNFAKWVVGDADEVSKYIMQSDINKDKKLFLLRQLRGQADDYGCQTQ